MPQGHPSNHPNFVLSFVGRRLYYLCVVTLKKGRKKEKGR